jgi:hypothetical protein
MQRRSSRVCGFLVTLLGLVPTVRADAPPDPLRLVPDHADAVVKIDNPRRLIETVMQLDQVQQLLKLQAVQEFYDSTNARRFYQLVAYFEKELGIPWPEILDRLAGGGAAAAVKIGPSPPPVGVVIQGKDEKLLQKFVQLASTIIEGELARQESKDRLEKSTIRNVGTFHVGNDFHAATLGSALVVANKREILEAVITTHLDGKKNMTQVAGVVEARKLLPADPLVWGWLNFDPVHKAPQAKEVFAQPRNDPNLTIAFGGLLDVARRSPFLCGGLYREQEKLIATVRMPRGREGMPPELVVHIPPSDQAAALPLLEPKGVIYSVSYYLDLGQIWEGRNKLFTEAIAKAFEDAEKKSAPFLLGNRLSKLLTQAGTHQRFVVVFRPRTDYPKTTTGYFQQLEYAFNVDMRDPAFARTINGIARGGALLARTFGQIKLKLVEEKLGDVSIIGYRIEDQDKGVRVNANNNPLAFAPSPSFAIVGNQVVAASTVELCRELVGQLQREATAPSPKPSGAAVQGRLYGVTGADILQGLDKQLFAQTVLAQALAPEEAREQVRMLIDWVRSLGAVENFSHYGEKDFRLDLIYSPRK